ncbi:hypothetical protein BGZ97_005033 [Linnemannia gamsii]|uniref:Uncharacterized protein n=1 Tax=Linnemannia gamsii TaxID=64522 RepID=A0A9P6QV20_9FUNG|nr:hypothetical protein BGZ97_005033 [Linnemannia gamsii]
MSKMGSSSSPSAGEDPNVCLRFSLGPTNLGILRPHLDIMKEQPVVIEQRDFHFDVYGQPADVANAIAYNFLGPTKSADRVPPQGGSVEVFTNAIPGPKLPSSVGDASPGHRLLSSAALTGNDQQESDTAIGRIVAGRINIDDDVAIHGSAPNWKTDYDLAWERSFGTPNSQAQATAESQEPKPWSVTILLSMPFRVIQYLMLTSHGFKTYLVEEPNLDACARQGISRERLKLIAQQAGMVVAINNVQLPSLESNPEESLIWLQLDDRKALQAVLLGVGKALAQEPVLGVIQKGLGQDELVLRKAWDGILDQTSTSGAMPNEREWVMATEKESVRSAESVQWDEPSMEDRQRQSDRNAALTAQRRRPTERARHPLTQRISSPNRTAENRRRSERDAWNNRLAEERDRWDTGAVGVDRPRWDTPSASIVAMDPWTTTTSQSVGSFFTESEHHGAEPSIDGIGVSIGNSSASDDSQGCGRSSRSTSSQEVRWTIATREPRLHDDDINNSNYNNNNEDPCVTTLSSCEDTESLEPAIPSVL